MSSMPPIRRTIKNVVRNYSEAQVKVREATSNDPWGPSSTLMSEIADLTYNVVAFTEIMQMIWKRLNDHGKNWRHVYKALTLLDYIIKTGSEKVAQQCKENIFAIQTLKDFQYKEENKDQGMNVREKAKSLVQLLKDDERLRNERAKALKAKERFAQNAMGIGSNQKSKYSSSSLRSRSPNMDSSGGYSDAHAGSGMDTASPSPSDAPRKLSTDLEYARPSSVGEEEIQLQLALAMSKEEHDESVRRQKNDDIKLHLAMEESRKQADEDSHISSSGGLFSLDSPQTQPPIDPWSMPQPTHTATDPWGAPLPAPPSKGPSHGHASPTPAAAAVVDPWESPARTQQNQTSVSTDPWGGAVASGSPAYPTSTSTSASDPWGSQGVSSSSPAPPSSSSPWETAPAARASPFDNSFGASPAATTNGNGLDDDFDLLSGRNTSPGGTNIELEGFDPLGGQKSDAFDLTGMNQSLSQTQQQQSRKTPQEFLGDNANLVNLDQLVTKTSSTDTNPFANKSTNPFDQLQQQQQASTRRTLNQLQNNYHSSGFSQPAGGSLLPNPMVPHNGTQSTAQPSQQSYNPFL